MERRRWVLLANWVFAVSVVALLSFSMMGAGRGVLGTGWLVHMAWSYLVLLVGIVLVFAALWPERAPTDEAN